MGGGWHDPAEQLRRLDEQPRSGALPTEASPAAPPTILGGQPPASPPGWPDPPTRPQQHPAQPPWPYAAAPGQGPQWAPPPAPGQWAGAQPAVYPPPRRSRRVLIVCISTVLVLALAAGAFFAFGGFDRLFGGEVFLEAAAEPGSNPFTPAVSAAPPGSTVPSAAAGSAAAAGGAVRTIRGGEPGLYGGTRNSRTCDRQQMIDFLAAEPAKAAAWAQVQGITTDQIPTYIRGLTPLVLLDDVRVTNYGFSDGRATPRQSVLQAGTAVLADEFGVPRAKCGCGNPLREAQATRTAPRYQGPPWPDFRETNLIAVGTNDSMIDVFMLLDVQTGERFDRPVGTDGDSDAKTGQVQAQLSWRGPADLDLFVVEPNGFTVSYSNPTSPTGGTLDVDANANCVGSEDAAVNIENIFWPEGQVPTGSYQAGVSLYSPCSGGGSPGYELRILVGGRVVHQGTAQYSEAASPVSFTSTG